MEIYAQNVNGAFLQAIAGGLCGRLRWTKQESRNGTTYEFNGPVITRYAAPCQRVLFHSGRDANPFFHFFEALWMLAGRDDVKFVASLVKRMADYSDDGVKAQSSYGHRWRHRFGMDQLKLIIDHLRTHPESRRAVLTMWQPQADMQGVDYGTHVVGGLDSKDIPCNTQAYFKVRDGKLQMTVCCRSNDLLWGAYGANVVHFSMLQEYVAGKLGLPLGPYYQVSDSLHVYTGGEGGKVWDKIVGMYEDDCFVENDPYLMSGDKRVTPMPMGCGDPEWDEDLKLFFAMYDHNWEFDVTRFSTPWFVGVVLPLWHAYKLRSVYHATSCQASDWRRAAVEWLDRHPSKKEVVL